MFTTHTPFSRVAQALSTAMEGMKQQQQQQQQQREAELSAETAVVQQQLQRVSCVLGGERGQVAPSIIHC